jgi:uncharacterized membrane protein
LLELRAECEQGEGQWSHFQQEVALGRLYTSTFPSSSLLEQVESAVKGKGQSSSEMAERIQELKRTLAAEKKALKDCNKQIEVRLAASLACRMLVT